MRRDGVVFKHITLGCKREVHFLAESICKSMPCLMLLWSWLLFILWFLQVSECSWPVRQAPSLHNLYAVCKNMHNWLQQNPKNVCVIHCMVSTPESNQSFRPMSHKSYCTLHVWSLCTRMVTTFKRKRNVVKWTTIERDVIFHVQLHS